MFQAAKDTNFEGRPVLWVWEVHKGAVNTS